MTENICLFVEVAERFAEAKFAEEEEEVRF